jgi:hypothetical protein
VVTINIVSQPVVPALIRFRVILELQEGKGSVATPFLAEGAFFAPGSPGGYTIFDRRISNEKDGFGRFCFVILRLNCSDKRFIE